MNMQSAKIRGMPHIAT